MIKFNRHTKSFEFDISSSFLMRVHTWINNHVIFIVTTVLSLLSILYYYFYLNNGLGLSYNDARSHLDIGRRVVEGLKPGLAQLGSVWLPLNHILMIPLIWIDWAWHSGFAGAIWNMISFVGTGLVINAFLKKLNVGLLGRLVGVTIFAANLNILYLQSTAMTEILLLFTMTMGCYYLLVWHIEDTLINLINAAFWIMLATLVRYDGWFLLGISGLLVMRQMWARHMFHDGWKIGWSKIEGTTILFATLASFGVLGWFLWNQLIFGDALYFALGPFSAHAQQLVMEAAGVLPSKYNFWLSIKVYFYALLYNTYTYPVILSIIGAIVLWRDHSLTRFSKWGTTALLAPLIFNILALFLGFSVIYVQGISGNTWFNIRYGVMLMPTIAIFIGYLVDRAITFRALTIGSLIFVLFFAITNSDAVVIDDARVGSSQKNVSEVAGWLNKNAKDKPGFVLISAASHDAIIFSSGLPMSKFIHEGTGAYWTSATTSPDRWARWIIMRTHDNNDLTFKAVSKTPGYLRYNLVAKYPFADIYELQSKYISELHTTPVLGKQR